MRRRDVLKGMTLGGAAIAMARMAPGLAKPALDSVEAQLAMLERRYGGRLGVAILDTGSGRREGHRDDERFLMCSTFKLLLAAAVLQRVDRGEEKPDRRIVFGKEALLDYAPTAKQHVGPPGMTIAALCEAAVTWSDNTAANLLLKEIGGPQAVTAYARSLGDRATVLDRYEPALNPVDTTTPKSMLGNMQQLLLGDRLSQSSRESLIGWMVACQTGLQSLRAGMPGDWRVGDKTGQWDGDGTGANNDIAIAWPPQRKPILVSAYYMNHTVEPSARKAVLAEVGRIVASM
ncbi:MAG: Class A beta-lactamase [Rhodanobacteraceae bacterium]|jgi:beta-lactamase class A|nr:MAG: Class A beta-lactamase [Rhodanobacteraceae bacterium]